MPARLRRSWTRGHPDGGRPAVRAPRRRPRRAAGITALVAVAVTLLGACSAVTGTPQQATPTAAPPAPPAALAKFYSATATWGPCTGFAPTQDDAQSFANPELDCTRVDVPLDYANPQGPTVSLPVLRKKATEQRIGSLFFNPGGPGSPGTSLVAGQASDWSQNVGKNFDLIGFDPRGTGTSKPKIDCLNDQENDQQRALVFADPSPKGVAAAEANSKLYADRCTQRVGPQVLENVGTRDAAKDMDILRQVAGGDEKLNYLGYSYGTELGTAYAEDFPQRVRALVLDGAIDPTESTIDSSVKQAAGFQLAFDNFAKDCASKPGCPLGQDPARATQAFQTIVRPLLQRPVPVGDGRTLSFSDAVTGVTQALYLSDYWPVLRRGISEVATGRGRVLQLLADAYYERSQNGTYSNNLEAFQVISCVNQPRVTDPAQVRELAVRSDQAAPYRSTGLGPVVAKDPCAFWPVPPTSEPHTPKASGLPRTLVVSVTGDPATPYQAGVDLAKQLGGTLIKVNGNQHTASLRGNECLDSQVVSYLKDPASAPEGQGEECTLAPS